MITRVSFDGTELTLAGLNLQAVINIQDCSLEIQQQLSVITPNFSHYNQIVLIGHGGRSLWEKVKQSNLQSDNPIDDYSRLHSIKFFKKRFPENDFEVIFPRTNQASLGLQALGQTAGWHNESPFRIGVNKQWGSWFAYRAVVLVKSDYQTSVKMPEQSPCQTCESKVCLAECPADALINGGLDLKQCISYRLQDKSKCKDRCLARMVCPIASEHQYQLEQIQYHYLKSYQWL